MDYDKLLTELYDSAHPQNQNWKAATAIETLHAENEKLSARNTKLEDTVRFQRNGLQELREALTRVTAERDEVVEEVKHLKAVMRDKGIVVIPPKYPWEKSEWNL